MRSSAGLLGKDDPELEFAKALNKSVHGSHLGNDIDKKEVAKKLKQMLQEKKAVVGPGDIWTGPLLAVSLET